MAIDDNTLYGLTGAQVKELPERIEAVRGLARVLTTDDYNWPTTGTKTGVALWLLEPGMYLTPSGIVGYLEANVTTNSQSLYVVSQHTNYGTPIVSYYYSSSDREYGNIRTVNSAGLVTQSKLYLAVPVDNLTSTSTGSPLTANQGKVLNDKIGGDLSNLTTTDKTSLINAINEIVGSGGGGITELTSADYNYPTASPNGVLPFKLTDGVYKLPAGLVWWDISNTSLNPTSYTAAGDIYFIVTHAASNNVQVLVLNPSDAGGGGIRGWNGIKILSGNPVTSVYRESYNVLPSFYVTDSLTSTSTTYPLSANQGKVLKGLIDSIAIRGTGAPTTSTVGTVGQLYEDGTNGALYQLKSIDITVTPNTYNWEQVGGSSVNVVQTTGTSTTDVMSQNATTSMVFADPANRNRVQIGRNTSNSGVSALSIGTGASANGDSTIAIGSDSAARGVYSTSLGNASSTNTATRALALGNAANAIYDNSVAIGTNATTSAIGEFNIGAGTSGRGYNSSNYRLLTGLYDPQSVHDAATKGYVDGMITMTDTDPGEGVALAENEYIAVYGGDTMNLDYSTTEKATGGTWIDGSAIYKKTVNFGALPNNADKTVAHDISNLGRVVKLEGMAYNSSTSTYAPLPYASDSTSAIDVSIVGSNIRIHTFTDRTAFSDAYITIYYTKSS